MTKRVSWLGAVALLLAVPLAGQARTPSLRQAELARSLLGRTLSPRQKLAVYRAHTVGKGQLGADRKNPAQVGNYSWRQLLRKERILGTAGFDRAERRTLVKGGVVGFWGMMGAHLASGGQNTPMQNWMASRVIDRARAGDTDAMAGAALGAALALPGQRIEGAYLGATLAGDRQQPR